MKTPKLYPNPGDSRTEFWIEGIEDGCFYSGKSQRVLWIKIWYEVLFVIFISGISVLSFLFFRFHTDLIFNNNSADTPPVFCCSLLLLIETRRGWNRMSSLIDSDISGSSYLCFMSISTPSNLSHSYILYLVLAFPLFFSKSARNDSFINCIQSLFSKCCLQSRSVVSLYCQE